MVGLPNHKVIPDGWSEHHQPVAESSMTGSCDILPRKGEGGNDGPVPWDQIGEVNDPVEPSYSAVPCRVQQLNTGSGGGETASGRLVVRRTYLVTLPINATRGLIAGDEGQRLIITEADDPEAVGRVLTIQQVLYGTLAWERDLLCRDDQVQNQPEPTG